MIQGEHNFNKIIGIDPGVGGGIAVYTKSGLGCKKMPVTKVKKYNGKFSSETNVNDLQKILKEQQTGYNAIVFIERVQAWLQDSDSENKGKQFRIGKLLANYETIKTIITMVGIPYIQVHPRDWQGYLNLVVKGDTPTVRKNRYKKFAAEHYPGLAPTGWNADAVCLVEFGRRRLAWDMEYIKDRLPGPIQLGL